jgi:hypothetical protein
VTSDGFAVILVYSTYHALKIERVLARENIPCRLVPVPRQLSSDCGVCVRVHQSDGAVALAAARSAAVEIQGFHTID